MKTRSFLVALGLLVASPVAAQTPPPRTPPAPTAPAATAPAAPAAPTAPAPAAPATPAADAPPAGDAPVPGFAAPLAESLSPEAKVAYDTALLLYKSGDYATAFIKFEQAHRATPDPRLLWNMAACQRSLRRYAHVQKLARLYLVEAGDRLQPADRAEVERLLVALDPLVAPLAIDVAPAGATVFIDGENVGVSPLAAPIPVAIGTRKIRGEKSDFQTLERTIEVTESDSSRVELRLVAIPKQGRLAIAARPGSTIWVDGKQVGRGRWEASLEPGPHRIRVEAEGFVPQSSEIVVTAGATRSVDVALEQESAGVPGWAWIGGGAVVAAGLVVGGYFLFQPADPEQPQGNFDPGNVVVYPASRAPMLGF